MTSARGPVAVGLAMVLALILQTTLFGRLRIGGIAPDVVLIALILTTLRIRNEPAMILAFSVGLLFDALSSTAIGLRAIAYTSVIFIATRTRDRADFSPFGVAVWVGVLTAAGVIILTVVGTLFSQVTVSGGEAVRRVLLVPVFNLIIALVLTPLVARLLQPARRGL